MAKLTKTIIRINLFFFIIILISGFADALINVNTTSATIGYGQQVSVGYAIYTKYQPASYTVALYNGNTLVSTIASGSTANNIIFESSATITQTEYVAPGTYNLRISYTDAAALSATKDVPITVTNNAPVLNAIGNRIINEGQFMTFTISGTDADSNPLTYSASGVPTSATFTPGTQTFSWTPTFSQSGNHSMTFSVTDGASTYSETIVITVFDVCIENWVSAETCQTNNQLIRTYTDSNACGTIDDLPNDNGTNVGTCDYCTPDWQAQTTGCLMTDEDITSYTDANNCYAQTGLLSDNNPPANSTDTCDYCTPDWTATPWGACLLNDTQYNDYYDANNCYAQTGISNDQAGSPGIQSQSCDYCTPTWQATGQGACQINDTQEVIYTDLLDCFSQTGLSNDNNSPSSTQPCDYCTPNPTNTSWSVWVNETACLADDTQLQNRTRITYDSNSCFSQTGLSSDIFNDIIDTETQNITCDYCTPDWITDGLWGVCQPQDIQYANYNDNNTCFAQTGLSSDLIGQPTDINQTCDYCTPSQAWNNWSAWTFNTCEITGETNQTRTRTDYDQNACYAQTNLSSDSWTITIETESRIIGPNYTNTPWTSWNAGACMIDDTRIDNRSYTEYDTYGCGTNTTLYEYNLTSCDYCTPNITSTPLTAWTNAGCSLGQMNQTRSAIIYDANNCYEITGLASDLFSNMTTTEYQLIGPIFANTSFTAWTDSGACLMNDSVLQERNVTAYDTLGCAANITITETQYATCDYCTPDWTLNATWTTCSGGIQNQNYYDNNSCFAQTGLASDLIGQPAPISQACMMPSIFNTTIYGISFVSNTTTDVNALIPGLIVGAANIDNTVIISDSLLDSSNVSGSTLDIAWIYDTDVQDSNITNSEIHGCQIINSFVKNYYLSNCVIIDSIVDPPSGMNNLSGTNVTNSTVLNTDMTNSEITDSIVTDSFGDNNVIIKSIVDNSTLFDTYTIDSTVNDSSITAGIIIDSDVTDSALVDVELFNSTIYNTTMRNIVLTDANVTDGLMQNGTIVTLPDGTNVTITAPTNVTDYINIGPAASFMAPNTVNLNVAAQFTSTSSDANIGGPLNDSINYSWNFGDGITSNLQNPTHSYAAVGEYMVALTVTDRFGLSGAAISFINITPTVTVTVFVPTSTGSSRGSSSGCEMRYNCTEWSRCFLNRTQTRTCVDISGCRGGDKTENQECTYIPEIIVTRANITENASSTNMTVQAPIQTAANTTTQAQTTANTTAAAIAKTAKITGNAILAKIPATTRDVLSGIAILVIIVGIALIAYFNFFTRTEVPQAYKLRRR